MQLSLMPDAADATFSTDGRYRYTLTRRWGGGAFVNFIMLNPSTADATVDDPTVTRCCRRARQWGYDGLVVTNLFAYRATDPRGLQTVDDPVGSGNNAAIINTARDAGLVVCAWGMHGAYQERGRAVAALLTVAEIPLHVLGFCQDGLQPRHPLYLPYAAAPVPWSLSLPPGRSL